jgi:hypothetical protein
MKMIQVLGKRTMIRFPKIAASIITACLAFAAQQASASTRESIYTADAGTVCAAESKPKARCKSADRWRLGINDTGNIIWLEVYLGKRPDEPFSIIGRGLGEKFEWRGTRSRKGFRPDALIVRMRPQEADDMQSSLLYIIKLNSPVPCLSGIMDAKATPNANAMARVAADKLPDGCDAKPTVYGQRSEVTDMLINNMGQIE